MKLLLGTSNLDKIVEILEILEIPRSSMVTPKELGITEVPEETGSSFLENALQKALFYFERSGGLPTLAEDTGLVVSALGGLPGLYSARFAGPEATYEDNRRKLLTVMKGVEDREAFFVCHAVLLMKAEDVPGKCEELRRIPQEALPNGIAGFEYLGRVEGRILEEERGEGGFGYDPIFYYPPAGKTFAELTSAEKNRISHRRRAIEGLKECIQALLS